jgi:hypothetical protein
MGPATQGRLYPTACPDSVARYTRITPEAIMLLVAMALLYAFFFSISISLTRQSRLTQRLTQELAFLERRCRILEAAQSSHGEREKRIGTQRD